MGEGEREAIRCAERTQREIMQRGMKPSQKIKDLLDFLERKGMAEYRAGQAKEVTP